MDSRVDFGKKGLKHLLGSCFPHSCPATDPPFSCILLSSCLCRSPPDVPGAAAAKGKERGGRDPAGIPAAAPCPARALAGEQDHRVSPKPYPALGVVIWGGLIPPFLPPSLRPAGSTLQMHRTCLSWCWMWTRTSSTMWPCRASSWHRWGGTAWWLPGAIRATLALSLRLCSVFLGKNNFHAVGLRWFKPQLSQGHHGATLAQSWCHPSPFLHCPSARAIPVPSQGHPDATPVHSHTIPVPSWCHPAVTPAPSQCHPFREVVLAGGGLCDIPEHRHFAISSRPSWSWGRGSLRLKILIPRTRDTSWSPAPPSARLSWARDGFEVDPQSCVRSFGDQGAPRAQGTRSLL